MLASECVVGEFRRGVTGIVVACVHGELKLADCECDDMVGIGCSCWLGIVVSRVLDKAGIGHNYWQHR